MGRLTQVEQARARVMVSQPFYGPVLANTKDVQTESVKTAATDYKTIYWNPKWVATLLDILEVIFVFVHEVLHIILRHNLRLNGRHRKVWNYACDYVINWMLTQAKIGRMPKGGLLDPRFANMAEEKVYAILMQEAKQRAEQAGDPGGDPGDYLDGDGGGMPADDLMDVPITAEEAAQIEADIKDLIQSAATMCKLAGNLPAGIDRLMEELLHPRVTWEEELREFMTRAVRVEENWTRRNRRMVDFFWPAKAGHAMGEVVFIGDTSGSVTNDELKKVGGCVMDVFMATSPERLRILWADDEVAAREVYEEGEEPSFLKPKGGGGTDMCVPMAEAEEYNPAVVIMVTDGYTPWPDNPPPYPFIVCCTTDAKCPDYARVLRINE